MSGSARKGGIRTPILVTGSHRSRSSWVGRMISLSRRVGYIHEPFNVDHHRGICAMEVPYWFTYVTEANAERFAPYLDRTLRFVYSPLAEIRAARTPKHLARLIKDSGHFARYRFIGGRPLMKDPLALFSTEWLARRYGMRVVVLTRHPAAFAASVRAQGYRHPFDHFLKQPQLMHDHLAEFEEEIGDMATRTASDVEEAALLWRITTPMTLKLRDAHPDWLFYRYEDLACDPSSFREIYDALDLPFTGEVRSRIARATNPNTAGWRRSLPPAEVDNLHSLVSDRSTDLYPDHDWTG